MNIVDSLIEMQTISKRIFSYVRDLFVGYCFHNFIVTREYTSVYVYALVSWAYLQLGCHIPYLTLIYKYLESR